MTLPFVCVRASLHEPSVLGGRPTLEPSKSQTCSRLGARGLRLRLRLIVDLASCGLVAPASHTDMALSKPANQCVMMSGRR